MIDTNELRRLAQAAMHPVTKGRWMRLFGERTVYDRMEDGCRGIPVVSTPVSPPHPFEAACLDFIAAANPAAVIEILDHLEAAESEALEEARLNGMGSEREAALIAKLEAAEKERDDAKAAAENIALKLDYLRSKLETAKNAQNDWLRANAPGGWIDNLRIENEALRAKVARMEKQEPVATVIKEGDSRYWMSERLWTFPNGKYPLYALPGAQGEEEEE